MTKPIEMAVGSKYKLRCGTIITLLRHYEHIDIFEDINGFGYNRDGTCWNVPPLPNFDIVEKLQSPSEKFNSIMNRTAKEITEEFQKTWTLTFREALDPGNIINPEPKIEYESEQQKEIDSAIKLCHMKSFRLSELLDIIESCFFGGYHRYEDAVWDTFLKFEDKPANETLEEKDQ